MFSRQVFRFFISYIIKKVQATPRKQPNYQHASTPVPYRTQQHYQQHQNAFRSPEEINISLQQRRPTVQPNRYEDEEDYSYEK